MRANAKTRTPSRNCLPASPGFVLLSGLIAEIVMPASISYHAGATKDRRRRRRQDIVNGRTGMTTVEDARAKDSAKGVGRTHQHRSEIRDGMRIEWDVPIKADDGLVLGADVFRPVKDGRYPALLSYGPYAKGLAFQD